MMKHIIPSLSLLVFTTTGAIAGTPLTPPQLCLKACYSAVSSLKFTTSPKSRGEGIPPPPKFLCSSFLPISSTYACYTTYCHFSVDKGAFYQQNITCGKHMPSYSSIMERVGEVDDLIVASSTDQETVYNTTVLPPERKVAFLFKSLSTIQHMRHVNHVYSWSLYTIVSCIAATAVLFRLFGAISPSGYNWRMVNFLKRHLLIPATFGYKHAEYSPLGKIPTRIESLIIVSYVTVNIILCCVNHPQHFGKDPGYIQNWDRLSDRACALALGNLPTLFLLAGRNNLLIWMTGIPYSTFNLFHRWTARVFTVEAVVHATSHLVLWVDDGGWPEVWAAWKTERFVYCGVIAFCSFIILNLTGNYQVRKRFYEIFLAIHVPLALTALVGLFFHVKVTHGSHNAYLWPCAGFWIFDRLVRVCRIVYAAIFARSTFATAIYDNETDMIRLYVRSRSLGGKQMLGPAPGQHYFIHTRSGPLGLLESHPFSLMAWSDSRVVAVLDVEALQEPGPSADFSKLAAEKALESSDSAETANGLKGNPQVFEVSARSPVSTSSSSSSSITGGSPLREHGVVLTKKPSYTDVTAPKGDMLFMLKPRSGMTARLKNKILQSGSTSIKLQVAVEGPYGQRHNFEHFNRVLLIAGGSGITALAPYARQLAASSKCRLLWCTRTYQASYSRELLGGICNVTTVHITVPSSIPPDGYSVDIRRGRINVHRAISDEMAGIIEGGRLAVVCCGPGRMCDDVRAQVVKSVGGSVQVEYFEENFGW